MATMNQLPSEGPNTISGSL